jgi:hypothetical protein
VTLDQPNGTADQYSFDNHLSSTFGTPNTYVTTFIRVMIKTDNSPSEVRWVVRDDAGNVVANRNVFPLANTTYIDTVFLSSGCYNATAYDSGEDGLCCYNGNGFFRILKGATATIIATKGDYGDFYSVNFTVDNQNAIEELENEQLMVFPNPSSDRIMVNTSFENAELKGTLMDMTGRIVTSLFPVVIVSHQGSIELPAVPNGMYILTLSDEHRKLVQRINIAR